jgi:ERCC4-type nuclease
VPTALQQLPGVRLTFKRLPIGDYVVDGRCVFERKTVVDFASSIADGRLFTQATRLVSLTQPAALILEGRSADLAATQMRRESLQGAMVCLSLIFHLPVLRSLDPSETARLMVYAAQQIRRHEWSAGVAHGRRPKRKRRIQLRILQGLPGIGHTRAEHLLESFGTVEAVMTASQANLEDVAGIGTKTATAIREVLQEAALPYRSRQRAALGESALPY